MTQPLENIAEKLYLIDGKRKLTNKIMVAVLIILPIITIKSKRDYIMKKRRIGLLCFILLFLISCIRAVPEPKFDSPIVNYPKYRIDDNIKKLAIIGTGPDASDISLALMKIITTANSEIKVIEPGNLKSVLKGMIIEYRTGLSSEESQMISQMLQIDHVLLFEEKVSPHNDYQYGGRAFNQISLKIINTLSGEIEFYDSSNFGVVLADPRPYGYSGQNELSTSYIMELRDASLAIIGFKLRYAIGSIKTGVVFKKDSNLIVFDIMRGSPSEKAGIQKEDIILEINGTKINNNIDYGRYLDDLKPAQGDIIKIKVKRAEKTLDLEMVLPIIPFKFDKPENNKPIKQMPSA